MERAMEIEVEESRYLRIRFTNGTERSFAFEPIIDKVGSSMLATHIQKMLDSRRLILQVEGRIMIFPFDNIESIEVLAPWAQALPEALIVQHEFT
jgi:hypothetical protein